MGQCSWLDAQEHGGGCLVAAVASSGREEIMNVPKFKKRTLDHCPICEGIGPDRLLRSIHVFRRKAEFVNVEKDKKSI